MIGIVFCTSLWKARDLDIPCKFDDDKKTLVFYSIVTNYTTIPWDIFGMNKEQILKDELPMKVIYNN